jgi:diguanylate cyclase (GGDEF)-like protein/PAS domain S-box-containing protein
MVENRSTGGKRNRGAEAQESAWSLSTVDPARLSPSGESTAAVPCTEAWLNALRPWEQWAVVTSVTILYFIVGKGGLRLAHENPSVSLVWPATGIAMAALLLLGQRAWPAIALGAFLVNVTTTGAIFSSLGIAAGNTCEALVGTWLARRFTRGWRTFERAQDILGFALLAGFLATGISATVGVTTLSVAGLANLGSFGTLWSSWWLGDAVGALVVAPLIVLVATQPLPRWNTHRWLEAGLLFGSLFLVSAILFAGLIPSVTEGYPLTFIYIPLLFWTAFRFGPREASLATLIISAMAIGGTVQGEGHFSSLPQVQSLVLVQAFLGVVALTTLAVAASVSESKRLEALATQLAAIVESSYDAIIGETMEGIIVSWNKGAERMYGYTAGEAKGRPISMLSPSQTADEGPQNLEKIERDEHIEPYETVRRRKDGSLVDISLAISPVRDAHGSIVAASAIARDITAQKHTEAALVEANDKLKGWLNQLEKETHEITLLNQMSHLLQTCITGEEAGSVIRQFAGKLFPGDSGAVCVRNSSQELVETIAAWGEYPPTETVFNRRDCWALRHGQLHAVTNTRTDIVCPHWDNEPWPANSLCVPMIAQGESLGVLLLRRPLLALPAAPVKGVPARFTVSREQLAVTVAGHIALALANLRLRETLRAQSIRDSLTGLYNRRYLTEALDREIRRAARGQRHLAVVLLDVDGFKGLNDTYGHEAGDTFLRELGTFLQKRVREEDVACRYGGDEFIIVLTETSLEAARKRARQLRDGIKTLSIPHRGQYLTPPTVSLGAALYPDNGATADELIRAADDALYKAKARGRDCLVITAESRDEGVRQRSA